MNPLKIAIFAILLSWPSWVLGADKPNILFIAIDDLNDWPSSFRGYRGKVDTPNIDMIANRGMRFDNAFSCAAQCSPSRNAMFWGMRQTTTGYYENGADIEPSLAIKNNPSLTEYFMQQGYEVNGAGKLYHGGPKQRALFSHFFRPGVSQKMDRMELNEIGPPGGPDWGAIDIEIEDMFDWRNANYIIEEIKKTRDAPLFLAYGIFKPHEPWYLPQKYFDKFPLDEIVLPEMNEESFSKLSTYAKETYSEYEHEVAGFKAIKDAGKWREGVQAYLAAIAVADECLGRIIEALKESGKYENTILVLWSDHGWHLGEKHHWRKQTLWEESVHCVLNIYAPGITKEDSSCKRTVSLLDLYPTLCDLAGLDIPKQVEGQSLVPLLKDPEKKWEHPAITFTIPGDVSVRSEDWHYIQYNGGEEELYDMRKDKMEWENLADRPEHRAIKERLASHIPAHKANYIGTSATSAKQIEKAERRTRRDSNKENKSEGKE